MRSGWTLKLLGTLLIALGGLALAFPQIPYAHREKVLQVGPLEATTEREEVVVIPRWLGGLALAAGTVLLLVAAPRPPEDE